MDAGCSRNRNDVSSVPGELAVRDASSRTSTAATHLDCYFRRSRNACLVYRTTQGRCGHTNQPCHVGGGFFCDFHGFASVSRSVVGDSRQQPLALSSEIWPWRGNLLRPANRDGRRASQGIGTCE